MEQVMHETLKVAATAVEAIREIKKDVAAYLEGGLDREAEDLELGERFDLDVELVRAWWVKVRGERAENERLDGFTEVHLEELPKPSKAEGTTAEFVSEDDLARINAAIDAAAARPKEIRRRENEVVAQPKEPEPKQPEPDEAKGPEPEPEEEASKAALPAVVLPPPPASDWDEAIVAMNEQHAIIDSVGGGKAVIASWEPSDRDPTRLVVVYQT
jgi:hypothetical protein